MFLAATILTAASAADKGGSQGSPVTATSRGGRGFEQTVSTYPGPDHEKERDGSRRREEWGAGGRAAGIRAAVSRLSVARRLHEKGGGRLCVCACVCAWCATDVLTHGFYGCRHFSSTRSPSAIQAWRREGRCCCSSPPVLILTQPPRRNEWCGCSVRPAKDSRIVHDNQFERTATTTSEQCCEPAIGKQVSAAVPTSEPLCRLSYTN